MSRKPQVITAAPVPFDDQRNLAFPTFEVMLARIEPHVDAVFVSGTTAEFPALSADERARLLRQSVEVFGPERVIAHVGAPSLTQVVPLAADALSIGVTKLSLLTPYYLPTDFPQIYDWYAAVAALPGAEVFVYLFPERSGIDVTPDELGELSAIDGVVGAKLSGRPNEQFERYVAAAGEGALILSGDDSSLPDVMRAGGSGIVSGVSAAFPERFSRLREAWMEGEDAVAAAQADAMAAVRVVGPTITRLKMALSKRHQEVWGNRMALPAVDGEVAAEIDYILAQG